MELRDTFRRRKMVRTFRADPVPDDVLDRIMSSVLHAPSAGFTQGNEFLVLRAPEAVADFFRIIEVPEFPMTEQERATLPPVVVVPMSNSDAYTSRYAEPDKIQFGLDQAANWDVPFWDVDAGMATMLILLAVVEEGLGALFAGIAAGRAEVLEHFGVPSNFEPIGYVGLGYPAGADDNSATSSAFKRRRRTVDQLVHTDRW